ncbi:Ca2-binding protein [Aureococcus anophagefferens]|nr:Ca2-binding protein [Aureococcus anophagefferens]
MFDKMGDGQINYREFVVGVSPLARGDVPQKLQFAFELYDVDETGHVKAAEMCFVLNAMNNVASWFGDPAMQPDEIDTCVEDVFKQAGGAMSVAYTENIAVIAGRRRPPVRGLGHRRLRRVSRRRDAGKRPAPPFAPREDGK